MKTVVTEDVYQAMERLVRHSKKHPKFRELKKCISKLRDKSVRKKALFEGDVGRLYAKGMSIKAIAKTLHVSDRRVSAVVRALPRILDSRKAWVSVEELKEIIIDMRRRCFTIKQIAKAVHKRDRYVSRCLVLNGVYYSGITTVIRLRQKGMGIKAIAKMLKISDKIVSRVVHTHCKGK